MSMYEGYAWFVASVWPDTHGTPTVRIHEWDRDSGQIGRIVESLSFGSRPTFYEVIAARHYQVVDGLLEQPVYHDGVLVALRQEPLATPPYS